MCEVTVAGKRGQFIVNKLYIEWHNRYIITEGGVDLRVRDLNCFRRVVSFTFNAILEAFYFRLID